jgi:MarR family transcriptional regulator, organic hydroperoxide resistance regulator
MQSVDLGRRRSDIATMKQNTADTDALTEELSNRLFFRLYQCANMLHKTGTRALDRHSITTQQWAILGALSDARAEGGIQVGILAAHLMVSRQNLLGVLSRLETQGLVARTVDAKDSRSRRIRLTEKGSEKWYQMQHDIATYYKATLSDFSKNDLIHMLHYMNKLRNNFCAVEAAQGKTVQA